MDDSWKGLFEITDVDLGWVFGMCGIRFARRIDGVGGKKGSAMLVSRVLLHCDRTKGDLGSQISRSIDENPRKR